MKRESQLRDLFQVLGMVVDKTVGDAFRGLPEFVASTDEIAEMDVARKTAVEEGMMAILRFFATIRDPVALKRELKALGIGDMRKTQPTLEELMDLTGYTALKKRYEQIASEPRMTHAESMRDHQQSIPWSAEPTGNTYD